MPVDEGPRQLSEILGEMAVDRNYRLISGIRSILSEVREINIPKMSLALGTLAGKSHEPFELVESTYEAIRLADALVSIQALVDRKEG